MRKNYLLNERIFELLEGDITEYDGKAIMVPANIDFSYYGGMMGVLGAIVRAAGEEPFEEAIVKGKEIAQKNGCTKFNGMKYYGLVKPFEGVVTSGGNIKDLSLIHIVSKDFEGNRSPTNPNEVQIIGDRSYIDDFSIRESVKSALRLADKSGFDSVGFPLIGTGLYRVPLEISVMNMVEPIYDHLQGQTGLQRISLILYGSNDYTQAVQNVDRFLGRK